MEFFHEWTPNLALHTAHILRYGQILPVLPDEILKKEIIIFILSFSLLTFVIFLMQNNQTITIHPHLA